MSFTLLQDPFTARHADHMPRLSGDWSLIEICKVTLESGVVGTATPDQKRLDKAKNQLKQAAIGIRDAQFPPKPDAMTCGYCPYRQICGSSAA